MTTEHARTAEQRTMRAVVWTRFGGPEVLRVTNLPRPMPRDDQVLVRVVATTVTAAEAAMRRGEPRWGRIILGITGPRGRMRVLGTEVAGVVEEVGAAAHRFRVGDEVFGFTGFGLGGNAEYVLFRDNGSLALKPVNASFEEAAAAVDGATTALYFLRDLAHLESGQRALIIGASGSVGSYAVQLAKQYGAEVTGVCGTGNVDPVRTLGADHVIDHTREQLDTRGVRYDVVFDTITASSFAACRPILTDTGVYLPTGGLRNTALTAWTRLRRGPRVSTGMSVSKTAALVTVKDLIEAGELTVVIDRTYPLDKIADAHRHVDTGHKRGNVVITV